MKRRKSLKRRMGKRSVGTRSVITDTRIKRELIKNHTEIPSWTKTAIVSGSLIALFYLLYRINNTIVAASTKKQEMQTIDSLGYRIINTAGDGSCMFRAIADQIDNNQNNYQKYRNIAMDFLENLIGDPVNSNIFTRIIHLDNTSMTLKDYISGMRANEWGNDLILFLLANKLCIHIRVFIFPDWPNNRNILKDYTRDFYPHKLPNGSMRTITLGLVQWNHYVSIKYNQNQ